MNIVFQVVDYNGITVTLSREVWEEKILSSEPGGHPEVAPYLDEIQKAITEPDVALESTRRRDTQILYRLGVGVGRYKGLHIVTVVKYVQEMEGARGYVSTVYLTRKLYSKGRILWTRPDLLTD
jgi:hypothetical protein